MTVADPDHVPPNCQYGQLSWPDVLPIAEETWGKSADVRERRCLALLSDHLGRVGALFEVTSTSRRRVTVADLRPEWQPVLAAAVERAGAAAAGQRVAVDVPVSLAAAPDFPTQLEALRLALRRDLDARAGTALAQVSVWKWEGSGGTAYTEAGRVTGVELRLTPPRR